MLLLKLTLAPVLIFFVSLAERRWGTLVSGLLIGLPLTSGPILYFLAVQQGPGFSARTSVGSLLGLVALSAFTFIYGRLSRSRSWMVCVMAASAAYSIVALLLGIAAVKGGFSAFVLACLALIGARLSLSPAQPDSAAAKGLGNRELILRMATAAALVFSLTAVADVLGPVPSGLIAAFPIYSSVLAVFNHMKSSVLALWVLRGVVTGALGAAVFFVIVASLLGRMSTGFCFAVAVAAAVGTQAILLPTLDKNLN